MLYSLAHCSLHVLGMVKVRPSQLAVFLKPTISLPLPLARLSCSRCESFSTLNSPESGCGIKVLSGIETKLERTLLEPVSKHSAASAPPFLSESSRPLELSLLYVACLVKGLMVFPILPILTSNNKQLSSNFSTFYYKQTL